MAKPASFAIQSGKRTTLELALDHLQQQAPGRLQAQVATEGHAIALFVAAPPGSVVVNADACTLCLSCVSARPASAPARQPRAAPSCASLKTGARGQCQKPAPKRTDSPAPPVGERAAQPGADHQRSQALRLRALQQTLWHA